jgi:hypothetical protein
MDLDKHAIINDLVTEAEKPGLVENDSALFDIHDLDLKAVVRFGKTRVSPVQEARGASP